jgi:hypothetical protein
VRGAGEEAGDQVVPERGAGVARRRERGRGEPPDQPRRDGEQQARRTHEAARLAQPALPGQVRSDAQQRQQQRDRSLGEHAQPDRSVQQPPEPARIAARAVDPPGRHEGERDEAAEQHVEPRTDRELEPARQGEEHRGGEHAGARPEHRAAEPRRPEQGAEPRQRRG